MSSTKTRTATRVSALLLGALAASAHADDAGIRIGYSERLADVRIQSMPAQSASTTMRFEAFDRALNFELEENRALMKRSAPTPDGVRVYRGRVAGEPGSWARFVVVDGQPRGMYFDGRETYAVEPAGNETSVYRLADVEIPDGLLRCSHVEHARDAMHLLAAVGESTSRPAVQRAMGATEILDVVGLFPGG